MSTNNNLPDYQELFGHLDFKKGEEARSVYSPAAYLADLLQLMEDEFEDTDIHERRSDIRQLLLDEENTYTEIPFLNIANEILEKKIGGKDTIAENQEEVYQNILPNAKYPFNTPFNLNEEEIKLYLKYLGISSEQLYKMFATNTDLDAETLVREYLGMSPEEWETITGYNSHSDNDIEEYFNYTGTSFTAEMSNTTSFMEATGLTGVEVRELLFQKLDNPEIEAGVSSGFWINATGVTYATLDENEENIIDHISQDTVDYEWFKRTNVFIRLAKKIGMTFTEVDTILRVSGKTEINLESLHLIAIVKKIHKKTELTIDTIMGIMSTINEIGHTDEDQPQDLFNSVFNNKYVVQDDKYIPSDTDYIVPKHYINEQYTALDYHDDLFSEDNDTFRKRIIHALGISKMDLEKIIQRLDDHDIDSDLWMKSTSKKALLNFLYGFTQLTEILDISHEEVFTLFDVLEQDFSILSFTQHQTFIHEKPSTQDGYSIILGDNIEDRLWLIQTLMAITEWMIEYDFTADVLWYITTGKFRTEKAEMAARTLTISQLDGILKVYKEVKATPTIFQKGIFDTRSASVIFKILEEHESKRCKQTHKMPYNSHTDKAQKIAEMAITALAEVHPTDFQGLGLEEPLVEKIKKNLTYKGYIAIDGMITMANLPETVEDFKLETDFSYYLESVFEIIHKLYKNEEANTLEEDEVSFSIYLSDLRSLPLFEEELEELYDNLIFNHYIDEEGVVKYSNFFSDPENFSYFDVNTHITDHSEEVYEILKKQTQQFKDAQLKLTAGAFDELELSEVALEDLLHNLMFNGYTTEQGRVIDKAKLLTEDIESFRLELQFYPKRKEILNNIQNKVREVQKKYLTADINQLTKIADMIISGWAYQDLQGDYLDGKRIVSETKSFFADTENQNKLILGYYFEEATGTAIFQRMQSIIKIAETYQFIETPLENLSFSTEERKELISMLQYIGVLSNTRHIAPDKIEYFIDSNNANVFSIKGFEDYNKEIFFMLQAICKEIKSAHQQITEAILGLETQQEKVVWEQLQSVFGLDQEILKIVSKHVFKGVKDIKSAWITPILETANSLGEITKIPTNKGFTSSFQRVRQYSVLANKLQLGAKETAIAFKDQDLVAKFSENLELPKGVTSIDALLETEEFIYLFSNSEYWTYRAADYVMIDRYGIDLDKEENLQTEEEKEIIDLLEDDEKLKDLIEEDYIRKFFEKEGKIAIDAAFMDKNGSTYIISNNYYHLWMKDGDSWAKRENEFGKVDNAFTEIGKIDASYVDPLGRLFLFAEGMYVRYSDVNATVIDSGYPKKTKAHWKHEGLGIHLPEIFPDELDAAFEGLDGETYFFRGNKFISSRDEVVKDIAEHWGKSKYDFKDIDAIDAAFTHNGITYVFIDDQVTAYMDCLENNEVDELEDFPKRIQDCFEGIPVDFINGIDAAFVEKEQNDGVYDDNNKIHFFKDDHTVAFTMDANGTIAVDVEDSLSFEGVSTIQSVEKIDAAMVGLDGYTYLFSGTTYIRYTTGNYKQVDEGYPRLISEDWEGLNKIQAAFVLDGKTYVFGRKGRKQVYVRYATKDYKEVDEKEENKDSYITPIGNILDVDEIETFPADTVDNFWSLPQHLLDKGFRNPHAILNAHDGKTYLFSKKQVIEFDHINRWWSEPKNIYKQWPELPSGINKIDAALAGKDGKTYLFFNNQYIRFSDKSACHIDPGYPRTIDKYWGYVKNNLIENCKIDAAVTLLSREDNDDLEGYAAEKIETIHTYLFSGDQFFRYKEGDYSQVELGYPKSIKMLKEEPRFKALKDHIPNQIDAVLVDKRTVYLFDGTTCHVISEEEKEKGEVYTKDEFQNIKTALIEEGAVYTLKGTQWEHISALEGETIHKENRFPKLLKEVPADFETDLDTVLQGADGNTYYFKGQKCYNTLLETEYYIKNQWGKPENAIYETEHIDTGFVGRDGNTYLFSGSQYYTYTGDSYIGVTMEEAPRRIYKHWGGLTEVAFAYVMDNKTYLFEKEDIDGNFRYAIYHTDDYILEQPEVYYGDFSFWGIPQAQQQAGFNTFDTILQHGDNLIFIKDQHFIRYHLLEQNWSYPQEIQLLYPGIRFNKTTFKNIQTAFKGADGKMYFFDEACFMVGVNNNDGTYTYSPEDEVAYYWGLFENTIHDHVDASLVHNGVTYLFSGNQYVRYSGATYTSVDEDYPKRIDKYLREELPFKHMTDGFQYELDKIYEGTTSGITAVITNDRNTYVFINDQLHVGSTKEYDTFRVSQLQDRYNAFRDKGRVDAAFVKDNKTYLFCEDQYIVYTGNKYHTIDPGYPKFIEESLAETLGVAELPKNFRYGIDAAYVANDSIIVFRDENRYSLGNTITIEDISAYVGVDNNFEGDTTIDAAYTDDKGKLYVFKGNQFIRYSDTDQLFSCEDEASKFVDPSYPKYIKDHKLYLPHEFSSGINGAFILEDKLYTTKGNLYAVSKKGKMYGHQNFYPQSFDKRWGDWSDYLVMDIYLLARLMNLNSRYSSSEETLISLLSDRDGYTKEPYYRLAEIFGFDKEEIRWVKQQNAFISPTNALEKDFTIETIIKLFDILSTTERIKVDVKALYQNVWQLLYDTNRDAKNTAAHIYAMLAEVDYNDNYATLFDQIERELNVIKRDALVPYAVANDDKVENTRDLYENLLIDTQMEGDATTSRIKEATMAIQLFFHRYFLNLEETELKGNLKEHEREVLRQQWEWMRNYRVWEANRKVFLYPENYIRPELRDEDQKTPAFETLEQDLMQEEITEDSVERIYKKYLDEFTEVSRLKIVGGYLYDDVSIDEGDTTEVNKRLVVLGRTKTDPYRYYYRFGNFINGETHNDSWEPWEPVNITIEADRVYPVYAFNKVFIFWTRVEPVPNEDSSSTTITDNDDGTTHEISSEEGENKYTTRIYYSYYNLNKEWIQPQVLKTSFEENIDGNLITIDHLLSNGQITNVQLFVEHSNKLDNDTHDNIVISCKYNHVVNSKEIVDLGFFNFPIYIPVVESVTKAFNLTPELYSQKNKSAVDFDNRGKETFERLFDEGTIEDENIVVLHTAEESIDASWFAYDHKGGSFLCKPDVKALDLSNWPKNRKNGQDEVTNLEKINAAFSIDNTTYYFSEKNYFLNDSLTGKPIKNKFGKLNSFTEVTAAFTHNNCAYVFDDNQFIKYTDNEYSIVAEGFPKENKLSVVLEELEAKNYNERDIEDYTIIAAYTIDEEIYFNVQKDDAFLDYKLDTHGNLTETSFVDHTTPAKEWNSALAFTYNGDHYIMGFLFEEDAQRVHVYKNGVRLSYTQGNELTDNPIIYKEISAVFSGIDGDDHIYIFSKDEYIKISQNSDQAIITDILSNWSNMVSLSLIKEDWKKGSKNIFNGDKGINAAYVRNDKLFLLYRDHYVRHTISSDTISDEIDPGYPKQLPQGISYINATFTLEDKVYLFKEDQYYTLSGNEEPNVLTNPKPVKGNWGNIPLAFRKNMDAALNRDKYLFVFKENDYIKYELSNGDVDNDEIYAKPFEIEEVNYEIIRLTSSTAKDFNRLLFTGSVDALLQLSTQQIDEEPAFSFEDQNATTIKVNDDYVQSLPVSSHIDYNSANGMYYWEVFFHAPFLIAMSLNTDQKFEEAKKWYEHIYDPTAAKYFWKFLPFQAVDIDALIEPAKQLALLINKGTLQSNIDELTTKLKIYDDEFLGTSTTNDIRNLQAFLNTSNDLLKALEIVNGLINDNTNSESPEQQLLEILQLIQRLPENYALMQNTEVQITSYLNDPFDPHAIAGLRHIAYRKAIVMNYIDNVLDWGDMLFRQYTRESINEARMLYVLAYDLLGTKPENLGEKTLSEDQNYEYLAHNIGEDTYDFLFLLDLENDGEAMYDSLTFAGQQHDMLATLNDSVINPYFHLPENQVFMKYWGRVEDRLFKIRHTLNIMGQKQPLPLFQPPIDPMALVSAIAGGASLSSALSMLYTMVPHYRFTYMIEKAKEYTERVAQFGGELLSTIEKKDAEEMELLRNKQEGLILALSTQIKEDQIREANYQIKSLEESLDGAKNQRDHYQRLLDNGMLSEEEVQIALMITGTVLMGTAAALKIASTISYLLPQVLIGPFIAGTQAGGRQLGDALDKGGEALEITGETLMTAGEIAGIYAQHKRSEEDWELQKVMAESEIKQLEYQIMGAQIQKAIAQRELQIHDQEIKNNKAIENFMKQKFSNLELYNWMSSKLSGLFYQTYKMAHDIAKKAEKAFVFETGTKEAEIQFIGGTYWDSQKKGLLSGETLGVDLTKMEKAYIEQDSRGMEITKNISMLELDPLAFIQLKMKGVCEFRLTEELFDQDFPGHYNRQMKTISLAFDIGEGKTINATLTQLNNKLVMEPDPKAVKYLLNPKGDQPLTIRTDWKVNQQIALSYVDQYTENNGMFELRYDDARYLPFEGTGAVSLWRLELHGKSGSYDINDLLDVTIKLRYTAEQGGTAFANSVKGALKPYRATSFFDLAYTFPEQWNELMIGDSNTMELTFTRDMFPGMTGSKVMGIMVRYQYEDGGSATLELNDELKLTNNQYLEASNLNIARNGSNWKFTVKGDKLQITNVEMVVIYKAKV
ncbi:hypothetical protein AWE51_17580 [Aquimarina aggregata]|uniref:Hemopexin n=1 Tax=Aquimarina aggregata TaxID=1642818 RepID=A0A162X1I0_9FLAO|nr:hemopexin repeat-containing protein [Aquimarina aggregata]KZS38367.1 hypothetical protein AWE51_17580 [Aquimarina aggregata]